ncbi:hypothetical protein Unana1_07646 [Umbelopsis nana]
MNTGPAEASNAARGYVEYLKFKRDRVAIWRNWTQRLRTTLVHWISSLEHSPRRLRQNGPLPFASPSELYAATIDRVELVHQEHLHAAEMRIHSNLHNRHAWSSLSEVRQSLHPDTNALLVLIRDNLIQSFDTENIGMDYALIHSVSGGQKSTWIDFCQQWVDSVANSLSVVLYLLHHMPERRACLTSISEAEWLQILFGARAGDDGIATPFVPCTMAEKFSLGKESVWRHLASAVILHPRGKWPAARIDEYMANLQILLAHRLASVLFQVLWGSKDIWRVYIYDTCGFVKVGNDGTIRYDLAGQPMRNAELEVEGIELDEYSINFLKRISIEVGVDSTDASMEDWNAWITKLYAPITTRGLTFIIPKVFDIFSMTIRAPQPQEEVMLISHRWCDTEPVYHENFSCSVGDYPKLDAARQIAIDNGYKAMWIDSLCIDKRDKVELEYMIRVMGRLYQNAPLTVVLLHDGIHEWAERGWCLQEGALSHRLLVKTYGTNPLRQNRGVPLSDLGLTARYTRGKFWELLHCQQRRNATRPEDLVYSLLGFLNIDFFVAYGEGLEHAHQRLLKALAEQLGDLSGFRQANLTLYTGKIGQRMFPRSFYTRLSPCGYECISPGPVHISHAGMAVQCVNIRRIISRWTRDGRAKIALIKTHHPEVADWLFTNRIWLYVRGLEIIIIAARTNSDNTVVPGRHLEPHPEVSEAFRHRKYTEWVLR